MQSDNIIIRRAGLRDIDTMCTLLAGLFEVEQDFLIDFQKQRDALNLLFMDDNKAVFVASNASGITGMITGQFVVSTAAGGYSVLLEDLFVLPGYRGRGIASLLISQIISWSKSNGALRIQLVADEKNTPALDLYKKAGFSLSTMRGLYKVI